MKVDRPLLRKSNKGRSALRLPLVEALQPKKPGFLRKYWI